MDNKTSSRPLSSTPRGPYKTEQNDKEPKTGLGFSRIIQILKRAIHYLSRSNRKSPDHSLKEHTVTSVPSGEETAKACNDNVETMLKLEEEIEKTAQTLMSNTRPALKDQIDNYNKTLSETCEPLARHGKLSRLRKRLETVKKENFAGAGELLLRTAYANNTFLNQALKELDELTTGILQAPEQTLDLPITSKHEQPSQDALARCRNNNVASMLEAQWPNHQTGNAREEKNEKSLTVPSNVFEDLTRLHLQLISDDQVYNNRPEGQDTDTEKQQIEAIKSFLKGLPEEQKMNVFAHLDQGMGNCMFSSFQAALKEALPDLGLVIPRMMCTKLNVTVRRDQDNQIIISHMLEAIPHLVDPEYGIDIVYNKNSWLKLEKEVAIGSDAIPHYTDTKASLRFDKAQPIDGEGQQTQQISRVIKK